MANSPIFKIIIFVSIMYTYNSLKIFIKNRPNLSLCNSKNNKQCIISSKNKKSYCGEDEQIFIDKNEFIYDKKLITISPGGFKGFYLLGILTYLKENYETSNLIFSGASAGAWNSLFMSYRGNHDPLSFIYNFLDINIRKAKSLTELQYLFKYKLLSNYKSEDFDLRKIFIGVTTFKQFMPNINIYTDFEDLEDAINCCMASSHIPLITGGLTNRYKNMFSLDGGFSEYPYLDKNKLIHISPSMWNDIKDKDKDKDNNNHTDNNNIFKRKIITFKTFSEFFSMSKNNLLELFDNGYQDAKLHKEYFDEILDKKNEINDAPEF
jgi:hypothetical protein